MIDVRYDFLHHSLILLVLILCWYSEVSYRNFVLYSENCFAMSTHRIDQFAHIETTCGLLLDEMQVFLKFFCRISSI